MWLLRRTVAVPAHGAFVALGRPWRLRRFLGGHRRAARHHPDLPPYAPGERLRFGTGSPDGVYAVDGWAAPTEQGRWSLGGLGRVVLPLRETIAGAWVLEAESAVVLTPYRQDVEVDVVADGRRVATWRFVGETLPYPRAAPIRSPGPGPIEILFVVRPPAVPMDARVPGSDDRQLGILLAGLRLGPAPGGLADRPR
jgi:hypothetical protein